MLEKFDSFQAYLWFDFLVYFKMKQATFYLLKFVNDNNFKFNSYLQLYLLFLLPSINHQIHKNTF
jgi:hypothetical protein